MNLRVKDFEAIFQKSLTKSSLKQVEAAIAEVQTLNRQFRRFDFKGAGLTMTAVEFYIVKSKLKNTLKILTRRRAELLKERS